MAIRRKINSINTSPSGSAEPLFNFETHMTSCPQCKNATDVKHFCEATQQYINQDYKSAPPKTIRPKDLDSLDPKPIQKGQEHTRAKTSYDDVKMPPPKVRAPVR